jgi:transposase
VVIMNRASWHQSYLADEFDNLTLVHIPPYSAELNPIEQVWRLLRQNELANRCFDGYNDIVDQCCRAWDRFCEGKNRVIWQCYRDWVNLET